MNKLSTCPVNLRVELNTTPNTHMFYFVDACGKRGAGEFAFLSGNDIRPTSGDLETLSLRLLELAQSQTCFNSSLINEFNYFCATIDYGKKKLYIKITIDTRYY